VGGTGNHFCVFGVYLDSTALNLDDTWSIDKARANASIKVHWLN